MSVYRYRKNKRALLINLKRLLLLAGLLSLAVLFARGCVIACTQKSAPNESASRGDILLYVYDASQKKTVRMELEDYIVHAVAGEMPASFEPEALKSQAVAARTYAVRRIASLGGMPCSKSGADVCTDSTCCQAYKTDAQLRERWGASYEANLKRIREAVYKTRGEILTYDGKPIEALYHSSAGGMTEDAAHVFASAEPYLVSVLSPGEESSERYYAKMSFSRAEAAKKLNKLYEDANVSAKKLHKQVRVLSRYESGRVNQVEVGGAVLTGRQFRTALGLNSANFTLSFTDSSLAVSTVGFGHGVGLSQYGANAMAKKGSGYREILKHYYVGVEIETAG